MAGGAPMTGTSGGDGGDADLTFFLLMQNQQALQQVNQLTQSLQRANAQQSNFAKGGGAPGGTQWWAGGQRGSQAVPPVTTPSSGSNASKNAPGFLKPSKNFAFGSEGVRVGHIRLSRSGLGISEKTLADRGLGGAVLGGQLTGRIVQTVGKYMESRRKGDNIGKALYKSTTAAVGGLARAAIEIFGFAQFAEGFNSIFAAAPAQDFQKLYQEFWTEGLGVIEKRRQEAAAIERKGRHKNRIEYAKTLKNMWVSELNSPAAKTSYWVEEIRRDLADEESERRAMTRSLTGRPLWKVVNFSVNEGIP